MTTWKEFEYDHFSLGDDCHQYGMWGGCNLNCPVLQRGECDADSDAMFNLFVEECADDEEVCELIGKNRKL